ncbi:saxitoxin and tetrodotoxin-binding protein 2 [Triplophysa dalaica]|uniref:saxitoxin and tetrodotoxin-binding protein 2 n=1 Tax=Triplophysa dalaica TaxID=1582913 RepID=UPI0024DFCE31|nr:saxitoxin and tetrodotoxin-binding protein 2 [Triplophysa dalaica]
MSNRLFSAALLCLFSISQANVLKCEEVTKPLILEDVYKSIMGKWIFLEGIADHHLFTSILNTLNSSWIFFGPGSHADTFTISQGNMLAGKCDYQTDNTTVKDSTLYRIENDTLTEGKLLPSCSDCFTMSFISKVKNETIKSLYFFKRQSPQNENDLALYRKQAECLGFRREPQYSYDGVTEFCNVEKTDQKNVDESG